jgi:predicted nucleotidyltransferase
LEVVLVLARLFGSKLRSKIIGWMFSHPDEIYFGRQLAEILKEDSTNISRELRRLAKIGILTCQNKGRQKHYQANRECPIFAELQGLALKTTGLADVLRKALSPLSNKIKVSFVYGSFAVNSAKADSDVDLMVIGKCSFGETVEALMSAQARIGREINPSVYPVDEFQKKIAAEHHFLKTVLTEKKIFLIGNEDELAGMAKKQLAH